MNRLKNHTLALCVSLTLMPLLAAASTTLTAADNTSQQNVWVGTKTGSNQKGFVSELIHADLAPVPTKSHQASKINHIKLPSDISDREIIGLAANKNTVLVFTQWTMEQGDEPQIHTYSPSDKSWKSISKIPCNALSALEIDNHQVSYTCEVEGKPNKTATLELPAELSINGKRSLIPQNDRALKSLDTLLGISKAPCKLTPHHNKSK